MTFLDSTGSPMESTVVRLRNDGDIPFTGKYARMRYTIEPGGEAIVPYMAMCLWLGHPDSVDIDKKHRYRTDELRRLYVKYGIYELHHLADEKFPKISAWSITDPGHEYITVVRDPDGKHLTPDVQTKEERFRLEEQMRAMQDQIKMLQAQITQNAHQQAADILAGDTRTDNPTHRPEIQVQVDSLTDDDEGNGVAEVDRPGPRPVQRQV